MVADPQLATPPSRPSVARRLWGAPLGAHLAALAVVLLALVPLIGTGSSFSADEGAAIVQARSLARGDGWVVDHPLPQADPGGTAYPLELSQRGPKGTAPFVKHPLYALLLAGADRLAGVAGMVLLSVFGTVAAAGLAGLLARRIDPGLARPALWVTGLASPLLFDGYLVIAHTLAAACVAGAVLAAAVAFERRSRGAALAVIPCVAAAVLVRNEAVFFAAGLATAAVVVGMGRDRLLALGVAAGSLVAGAGAHLVEGRWVTAILGPGTIGLAPTTPAPTSGMLGDRWPAFTLTWLRPSYDAPRTVDLLLVVMVAALIFAAYAVRRGRPGVGAMAVAAGASAVLALVLDPTNIVPGLLVACPVVLVGLALAGRTTVAHPTARLAAVTAAVFALGVLATQYRTGGSGEWGGRYFALALPVALPVVLLAIRSRATRPLVAGLLVCSLAMSVMAVAGLRSAHRFGAGFVAAIDRTGGPDRPVLVTSVALVPRMAWPTFDHQRWLLSTPDDLGPLVDRLRAAGIDHFTFVAHHGVGLPPGTRLESSAGYHGWQILVVATA